MITSILLVIHLEDMLNTQNTVCMYWCIFSNSNRKGHKKEKFSVSPSNAQERSLDKLPPLPPDITMLFVRLVECLLDFPPQLDCLRYVCDHLLVSDLNEVKFVVGGNMLETSVSVFDGQQ